MKSNRQTQPLQLVATGDLILYESNLLLTWWVQIMCYIKKNLLLSVLNLKPLNFIG